MTRCPRLVEVEAAHDGRLDPAARASLAQHQRGCEPCQVAADALAALGPALATLPVPASDALAERRHRNRLLAAFERAPAAPAPQRARGRAALGALALAAVAIVVTRGGPAVDPLTAPLPADAAAVTVVATSARWSRHDEGGLTLVRLDDGELELHVAHGAAQHRLIVSLPDGELDDVGTTFHVSVVAGRTISVVVREGAVVVRRVGRPEVFLVAGERWFAEPVPVPPVASAPKQALPIPASPVSPPPAPPPLAPATRHPARNAIAAEFRDAVALLNGGRDAAAAAALSGFLAHHGDDPRAEDASYLLVLALQRTGDSAATRAAAREYLQRYPGGFRRAQAEALAHVPP